MINTVIVVVRVKKKWDIGKMEYGGGICDGGTRVAWVGVRM